MAGDDQEFALLEAAARHARERYQLYKAKAYGPRATSPSRLRELDRDRVRAETRLRRARTDPSHN